MVAKSNYTDPVMSSSLQNVNGMSLYHPSSPSSSSNIGQIASRNNRFLSSSQPSYQLYDTKSNANMSQNSLSPVMRDSSGYIKSVSPPTTNNVSYQNAIYAHQKQQQQYYGSIGKTHTPPGLNRSGGQSDISGYGTAKNQHHSSSSSHKNSHHNILTSSDTNLAKLFDRINSSDESVCSSSSRDLNLSSSQNQNPFQVYGTSKLKTSGGSTKNLNVWSDYAVTSNQQKQPQPPAAGSTYNETPIGTSNNNTGIPKKQQRGHKDDLVKAKPYNIQQNW